MTDEYLKEIERLTEELNQDDECSENFIPAAIREGNGKSKIASKRGEE